MPAALTLLPGNATRTQPAIRIERVSDGVPQPAIETPSFRRAARELRHSDGLTARPSYVRVTVNGRVVDVAAVDREVARILGTSFYSGRHENETMQALRNLYGQPAPALRLVTSEAA